jgi:broad specificity phosphatase PhoE
MDLQPLIDELQKPEYIGKTDAECADMINAKTLTVRRPVSAARIKRRAIELGAWSDIVIASEDARDIGRRRAALDVVAWLDDPRSSLDDIDLDAVDVQAIVAACVTHGLVSGEVLGLLQNMPNAEVRWVDHVAIGEVGVGSIHNARLTHA